MKYNSSYEKTMKQFPPFIVVSGPMNMQHWFQKMIIYMVTNDILWPTKNFPVSYQLRKKRKKKKHNILKSKTKIQANSFLKISSFTEFFVFCELWSFILVQYEECMNMKHLSGQSFLMKCVSASHNWKLIKLPAFTENFKENSSFPNVREMCSFGAFAVNNRQPRALPVSENFF